jgi:hypothetical protein
MRTISSRKTFFYKKVFPIFWFGFLVVVTVGLILIPAKPRPVPFIVFVIPPVMMLFGYVLMRALMFDLMDEVYDDGNRLIVKKGDHNDVIALSNIINVSHTIAVNPARIVLTLRTPCRFGKKVAFCPQLTWADIRKFNFTNSLADELVIRADEARRSA